MITLSLCMIVKNEEDTLSRCLESAQNLFDEIIIVDTGSNDKTKEIAKKYTNKIYDFKWCDDFSQARNYSFSKATKEYIMWLDADDIILDEDLNKLKKLKEDLDKNTDMVILKYNLLNKDNESVLTYYRERIVKKNKHYKWISPIHEVITPSGNIIYKDIAITHKKIKESDPKRNLKIFEKMIQKNYTFDARQTFYYARELYYNNMLEESISIYNKFLDMDNAWIENKISACIDLYNIYIKKNDPKKALSYLFKTFEYSVPRSEVCCYIGNYFLQEENYTIAKYWYLQACSNKESVETGGFFNKDFKDFIPYINLSVCYYYLGDVLSAKRFNDMAGAIKPKNESYINNKYFFKQYV